MWTSRAQGRVGNFPPLRTLQDALPTWSAASDQPETTPRDSWPFGSKLTSSAALKQKLEAHFPGMLQRHFLHLVPSTSRVCDSVRLRFGVLQPSALLCPHWSRPANLTAHRTKKCGVCLHTLTQREEFMCDFSVVGVWKPGGSYFVLYSSIFSNILQ